jgi:hypothetical protein
MPTRTGREIYKSRHIENGRYERKCAYEGCGVTFRANSPHVKYHTYKCKSDAQNRRFYRQHQKEIILSVILRRTRRKISSKKNPVKIKRVRSFDEMSETELLDFIRNNPDQVRGRR